MIGRFLRAIAAWPATTLFAFFSLFGILILVQQRTEKTPASQILQSLSEFQSLNLTLAGLVLTCSVAYLTLPTERFRATIQKAIEHIMQAAYISEPEKTQWLEKIAKYFKESCHESVKPNEQPHFILASFERLSRDRGRGKHIPPEFIRIININGFKLANLSLYFANSRDFILSGAVATITLVSISVMQILIWTSNINSPDFFAYSFLFAEKIMAFILWIFLVLLGVLSFGRYSVAKEILNILYSNKKVIEKQSSERISFAPNWEI